MSLLKSLIVGMGLIAILAGCQVKSSVKADDLTTPVVDKGVPGPNVDGVWDSGCQKDIFNSGSRSLAATFVGNTIKRTSKKFSDDHCLTEVTSKTESGTYKFISANKDGSYTVEYNFPIGNGWSALPKENLILDADTLYLSDYAIGDGITKDLMMPLKRKQ